MKTVKSYTVKRPHTDVLGCVDIYRCSNPDFTYYVVDVMGLGPNVHPVIIPDEPGAFEAAEQVAAAYVTLLERDDLVQKAPNHVDGWGRGNTTTKPKENNIK